MNIRYSIVIPVYNAQETLVQCVNSIERQLVDYEILLIDDGSTDQSLRLCRKLAESNQSIRVFSIENQGQSVARNVGIQQCKGEYIHFLDSDDFWLENSFKHIENFMEAYPKIELVFFSYQIYDQKKNQFFNLRKSSTVGEQTDGKSLLFRLLQENPKFDISPCRCLIRRTFLLENQLFFERDLFFEDAKWMFETFLASKFSLYVEVPLFGYRKSGYQTITSSHSFKKISDRYRICEYWLRRVEVLEMSNVQREIFLKRISEIYVVGLIGIWSVSDRKSREVLFVKYKSINSYLDFPNSKMNNVVRLVCKIVGIRVGSFLMYRFLRLKQSLKKVLH